MNTTTTLRQQIEEEMALDKRVNKFLNKFLKQSGQFYQVQERQGYDASRCNRRVLGQALKTSLPLH